MPENEIHLYEMCGDIACMHFVEPNEAGIVYGSPYTHLDDGEKEHNHDATPSGIFHTLDEWKEIRPELFTRYPDGKIGPNSQHFEV